MVLLDLNSPNQYFNPEQFRAEFPALNVPSVYLDSAATALKPSVMIDASQQYYASNTATSSRSLHGNALQVTATIDEARQRVAKLINAQYAHEIIWTRGATESVNLVAQSYARNQLKANDEIIVSEFEHHSNLIPWLIVAEQTGAKVVKWSMDENRSLSLIELEKLVSNKTRIIAITQMSNVTGYQPDLLAIAHIAHQHNALLLVDGAQGIVHSPIDVALLDIDFYLFSAHKLYAPTGLGVLYAKQNLLEQMSVWHGGGKMLKSASFSTFVADDLPYKFEAGTPNIAAIIGFNATLKWLSVLDWQQATYYTEQLVAQAKAQLIELANQTGIEILFYNVAHSSILSFNIVGLHHSDIAILLAENNIAIRAGELCTQPLMQALGCQGVIRASFMPYNNRQDITFLLAALRDAINILK